MNRALFGMANNFNLCVDEEDIEVLLKVAAEELTKEELLELNRST